MESEIRDYRLERWIAVILALMFFLPFLAGVANAAESPMLVVSSRDEVSDAPFAWHCRGTGIDGFDQCALMLDGKVLTWRMAPPHEELTARMRLDQDDQNVTIEISRNGCDWQSHVFQRVASHSSRNNP